MLIERVMGWSIYILRRNWVPMVLMSILVSTLMYSLQESKWVADQGPVMTSFLLGILFGYLISISRFPGWAALAYALFISIVIPIQGIGKILPSLGEVLFTSPGQVINNMNLRAVTLYLRTTGWIETLQSGENIRDSGIFVFLMGMLLSLCAIWLMWSIIRQRQALNGLLPVGLLYAINVHLSRQPLSNYVVFLFVSLLLMARSSFNRQSEDWDRRRVDYPDQLGLEWGGVALALAVAIVLVARAAPLFGTSQGWQAISEWVNRAHEQTNTTATRLFSGVNPPPPEPAKEKEIFVNTPSMDEIGSPIPQGSETIMWVKISDPPPPPPEVNYNIPASAVTIHYWRNAIFSTYTGRGWEAAPLKGEINLQPGELEKDPPEGRYYLQQDYEMIARHSGPLFAASEPLKTSSGVNFRQSQVDTSNVLEGPNSKYKVISAATRVTANQLSSSSPDRIPVEIKAIYLQLPDGLPQRVRTLAQRLTNGEKDAYHKALALENYLRENYPYDLTVPEAPANKDVVDYFLFDAPGGFCSHYASAMVVMLRSVGVPARIVTGYAMGDYDERRQAYRVPESASHAWVEVYFAGYGWIEFEPTAYRSPIVYTEEAPSVNGAADLSALQEAEKEPAKTQPYFIWLVVAGALALLVLPFLLLRMFTTSRQAPAIQVDVLYRRIRLALNWAGLGAGTSVTPDEYLGLYSGRLKGYNQLSQALAQATSLYRESVFSAHPPDERRVRAASHLWQHSIRDWLVLWLKTNWQRVRARMTD